MSLPRTLGDLRQSIFSEERLRTRHVKDELRDNLMARLRENPDEPVFPGIVGYDGNARMFDFGTATINHGKALAAEQYLTMPLSSDDQGLITQPGIEHQEFGGRPLDGAYTLRIWDSPDLNWNALQDIQIVFNYEYWSAIQVSGNTGDAHRPLIGHPRTKPIPLHRRRR